MISELEKLLMRGAEGVGKIKRTTMGGAASMAGRGIKKGAKMLKDSPGASALAGVLGGGAGYELGSHSGDDGGDEEEQERLARMLAYIRAGGE